MSLIPDSHAADDTDTGTDILIITEDDLADILTDPVYPGSSVNLTARLQALPAGAYAAVPAPIAQHRRMVSGRRSLITSSVHRHLQNGVYGMSVGAAGSEVMTTRDSRKLLTLRRRKSLYGNVDMDRSDCLLDYSYNRVVDRFLVSCSSWKFSSFTLNTLTGGHSLSHLLIHLFNSYDLIRIFHLDLLCLWKCFSEFSLLLSRGFT